MPKVKWTKGPWEYRNFEDRQYVGIGPYAIVDAVYGTGSNEFDSNSIGERTANARLIAAAPDMAEAIAVWLDAEQVAANCNDHEPDEAPECCEFCFPHIDNARCKMRAALAKARGEE